METTALILVVALAVGILARQIIKAGKGNGCAFCAESCRCHNQKFNNEKQSETLSS